MARIRTIKPEFWTDEKIVELSAWARLLFIGLWNFCDDDGRMECSVKRLKMQLFPADPVEVSELLGELRRESLVTTYAVDGKEYLQVANFAKHQKVDKRTNSKLPPPPHSAEHPPVPAEFPRSVPTEWNGREGKGREESLPTLSSKREPEPSPAKPRNSPAAFVGAPKPAPKPAGINAAGQKTHDEFSALAIVWPNSEATEKARKRWVLLAETPGFQPTAVLAAGRRFVEAKRREGEAEGKRNWAKFVPQLANWLDDERWNDPLPAEPEPDDFASDAAVAKRKAERAKIEAEARARREAEDATIGRTA